MAKSMTLKNIPDEVYQRLRQSAQAHHRSLNSEAIVCLESVLTPTRKDPLERLRRARELRALFAGTFLPTDIETFKHEGRA